MLKGKWILLFIPVLFMFAQDRENWIEKEFIGVGMDPTGMFTIGIPNEDIPEEPMQLLAGNYRFGGGTSRINFYVDGIKYTNDAGAASDPDLRLTDLNLGSVTFSGKSFDGGRFKTNWDIDGLSITQTLTPVDDPTDSVGSVIITYIFHNPTDRAFDIGMLSLLDPRLGSEDDVPICMPEGLCIGRDDTCHLFWGDEVPGYWRCNSSEDTTISALCDIGSPIYPKPDWMIVTDDREALTVEWHYSDVCGAGDIDGTAVIMWWEPRPLESGESFVVSYTFGTTKGASSGGDIDVTLIKPNWLNMINCQLFPNPVPIRFDATNVTPFRMADLTVDLTLYAGLELVEGEFHYDLVDTFDPGQVVNGSWIIDILERPSEDTRYDYNILFHAVLESTYVDSLTDSVIVAGWVNRETNLDEILWVTGSDYMPPEHNLVLPFYGAYTSDPGQEVQIELLDEDAGVDINTVQFTFIRGMDLEYPSLDDSTMWFLNDTLHVRRSNDSLVDGDVVTWMLPSVADNHGCINSDTIISYFFVDMTGPRIGDYWPIDTVINDSLVVPWIYTYDLWCRVRNTSAVVTLIDDLGERTYDGDDFPAMMDYHSSDSTLNLSRPLIGEWMPDGLIQLSLDDWTDDVDYGIPNRAPDCPFPAPDVWSFTVNAHGPRVFDRIPLNGWYTSNPSQPVSLYLYDGNGISESTVEFTIFGESLLWGGFTHESDSIHIYTPSTPWSSGDVVNVVCEAAEDTFGTTLDLRSTTSYAFTVDLDPPEVSSITPDPEIPLPSTRFQIDLGIMDGLAGLNYGTASVTVDGIDYTIDDPSLFWSSGNVLSWSTESVSWTPSEDESFEVCFHVEDSVNIGDNNGDDYCYTYSYDPSGPEVRFINTTDLHCGGLEPIDIYVFDRDGIIPSTIEVIIANDTLTLTSDELTYDFDTLLTYLPLTAFSDGDTIIICVTAITDEAANPASGLPLCHMYVIDAEPPALTYEVALDNRALWHIIDAGGVIDTSTIHVLFDGTIDYYWGETFIYFEDDTIIVFDYDGAGLDLVFAETYDIVLDFETKCGDLVESDGVIIYAIDEDGRLVPTDIKLYQNRPNPFNAATEITFELPVDGNAVLTIHDMYGRQIRNLHSGITPSGHTTVTWDGRDDSGLDVSSGYYLYRLVTEQGVSSKGMFLLK